MNLAAQRGKARWLVSAALAVVMIWAAIPKLLDPSDLATAIQNYRLVPPQAARWLAALLPAFELSAGIGLLLARFRSGAALLSAAMLTTFALAMAQARVRGIDLRCGCFGAAFEGEVSWLTVARSAGLAAAAAWVTLPLRPQTPRDIVKQSGAAEPPIS
jgi:putative oxidoreductase